MSDTRQAVLASIERMTASFHDADLQGVMAAYERDPTVVFQPGEPVSGTPAVREMFQVTFTLEPRFDYGEHEVVVAGDLALHIAPWTMRAKAPDGTPIEEEGLSVAVLRRQENGEWRMAIDNPHGQRVMTTR